MREKRGDARFEYLAADEAYLRMTLCLSGKMLATAKTDLKPNRSLRGIESRARFDLAALRNGQSEPRQQVTNANPLLRSKPPPAAAPKDPRAPRQRLAQGGQKARRSSSARSSLSHEKLPSGPGGRPKWPYAAVQV